MTTPVFLIRKDILQALEEYRDGQRFYLGGFLTSVLANDLTGAITRADPMNRVALLEIVQWCLAEMPAESWGSAEKVANWLEASRARAGK